MMKAPDRIDKIAKYVATHFRENVEPMGFKAFVVAVDRQACALYKNALDKYLPADYSRVVFSPAGGDREELKALYVTEDEEKKIRAVLSPLAKGTETPHGGALPLGLLTPFFTPVSLVFFYPILLSPVKHRD